MKLHLNLASRCHLNRRGLYAIYAGLGLLLSLILLFNVAHYLRLQQHGRQVRAHLAELEQNAPRQSGPEEISPARLAQLRAEVAFANEVLAKDAFRWTELLDRLEEVLTEGITIRAIQPEYKSGSLKLAGTARGVPGLRTFLDRLLGSPHFTEVLLLDQAVAKVKDSQEREREALEFSLVLKGAF